MGLVTITKHMTQQTGGNAKKSNASADQALDSTWQMFSLVRLSPYAATLTFSEKMFPDSHL